MKEVRYKTFSLNTHRENWKAKALNSCRFELTFACGLHCRHCYSDCYNKAHFIKKELSTKGVKAILDKVFEAGILWLCFTGGDPLMRKDFFDIYSYAKNKGFIITIFSNAYSMDKKVIAALRKMPPFVIEVTLNAITKEIYEKISQVRGSFEKAIQGLNLILEAKIPLKIKTKFTQDNFTEYKKIKRFVEGLNLKFRPSMDLHARLNGDPGPCSLRVRPDKAPWRRRNKEADQEDCNSLSGSKQGLDGRLFRCSITGGDGINIDPYGNMFACNLIREPAFDLSKIDIYYALGKLISLFRGREFRSDSKCRNCSLRALCNWCPGRAHLETGDMEAPIEYYCRLAYSRLKALPL